MQRSSRARVTHSPTMTGGGQDPGFVVATALRRWWPLALVVAVLVGFGTWYLVLQSSTTTYLGEATYVVPLSSSSAPAAAQPAPSQPATSQPAPSQPPAPAGGSPAPSPAASPVDDGLPASPFDAERLARNYAVILTADATVIAALAEQADLSRAELDDGATAVALPNSSTIRVSFVASSREDVTAYFTALDEVLRTEPAVSPNIPAGSIRPLSGAVSPTVQRGLAPFAPVVGVLVGIMLGFAAAVAAERLDTRVRTVVDLRALTAHPVFPLEDERDGGARHESLVLRAAERTGDPSIGLVAASERARHSLDGTRGRLQDTVASLQGAGRVSSGPVDLRPLGVLGTDGSAERALQDVDLLVVLVPVGMRRDQVAVALDVVDDLAASEVFAALVRKEPPPSTRPAKAAKA